MLNEFREFMMRGNVIDLAVGIIIGAAFTTVVNSLVNDILMPPIGFIIGGVDFSNLAITLGEAVTINYGLFINALIQFLIVGFAVFLVVRAANSAMKRFEKPEEELEEAPAPTTEEKLVEAIDRLNAYLAEANTDGK